MSVLNFCHLSFFFSHFCVSYDFTAAPSHFPCFRGEEKQLPHALFYLLLLSNDCVQILVRPSAPKDSIYQDNHKINTLPTQTAHGQFSRSAAAAGSGPAVITKLKCLRRNQPLVTSNLVHMHVLLDDPPYYILVLGFFFTNNDHSSQRSSIITMRILNHLDNRLWRIKP